MVANSGFSIFRATTKARSSNTAIRSWVTVVGNESANQFHANDEQQSSIDQLVEGFRRAPIHLNQRDGTLVGEGNDTQENPESQQAFESSREPLGRPNYEVIHANVTGSLWRSSNAARVFCEGSEMAGGCTPRAGSSPSRVALWDLENLPNAKIEGDEKRRQVWPGPIEGSESRRRSLSACGHV